MKKVFDCFSFAGEYDMLEIRLHTHNDVVDYFVIAESNRSHVGQYRDICFDPNDPIIKPFAHKIRYIQVTDFPGSNAWENEAWQRDAIRRGLWDARENDLIIISDCDEILRPEVIQHAKNHMGVDYFGFLQPIYFCFFNNINVEGSPNQIWAVAVRYRVFKNKTPTQYRLMIRNVEFPKVMCYQDAGWHYSYMMSKERIIEKLKTFAHQEFNNEHTFAQLDPVSLAEQGKDLLGRDYMKWTLMDPQKLDVPSYVSSNYNKFQKYFL